MRLVLAAVLVLSSCGGGGGGRPAPVPPPLRPGNTPDVVVISVSGRCFPLCDPPRDNTAYLGAPGDAAFVVARLFSDLGNAVGHAHFISSLYSYDDNNDNILDRHGFLELVDLLEWIHANWIHGFRNPTRIVLLAHSHGCVWAHMAASVVQHIPIDYLISLDGNCLNWGASYRSDIDLYFSQNGNPFPWDIRYPCDVWRIPGLSELQDTEDVVTPNVAINLEVRSAYIVTDFQINHRTDGSRFNVTTFDSTRDDHAGVHDPGGESMPWVLSQLFFHEQQRASLRLGPAARPGPVAPSE